MRRQAGSTAAIALVAGTLAAIAWFAVYVQAPVLGFADTDDPAVSLQFLREHAHLYNVEAVALIVLAMSLIVGTFATADALRDRIGSLGLRVTSSLALLAAACFFMFGVIKASVGPLLYIDGLRSEWGEAAYLVVHMLGTHGFAQGALIALGLWVMTLGFLGWRARALPLWLSLLAIVPAIRVIGSPLAWFAVAPDELWIVSILAIPVMLLWPGLLGLVLVRRGGGEPALAGAAPPHGS